MEQLNYNLLFRWVVALNIDEAVWDHSTFSFNRERLFDAKVAQRFFEHRVLVARLKELVEEAAERLPQLRGSPVVALSAETGRGLDRLMPAVRAAYGLWNRRIATGELNRWFESALTRHPPPAVNGRRVKLRYATMTKARPPTITVFGTRAEEIPDVPWLVIQGDADEIVDAQAVYQWIDALPRKPQLVRMVDTSHFFHRKLIDLRGAIQHEVKAWLPPA